jgi:hypothetical protein
MEGGVGVACGPLNKPCDVRHPQVVPIKKLLLWLEMARQEVPQGQKLSLQKWEQVLRDLS